MSVAQGNDLPPLTIFIGLGGSGQQVLLHLRRRWMLYADDPHLQHVRFLAIDRQPENLLTRPNLEDPSLDQDAIGWQLELGEFISCDLVPDELTQVHQEQEFLDRWKWLELESLSPSHGIQARETSHRQPVERQLYRVAFLRRYELIRSTLLSYHLALSKYADLHQFPESKRTIRYIVVAPLGEATAAGLFLDLGYLIHSVASSIADQTSQQHHTFPSKPQSLGADLASNNGGATFTRTLIALLPGAAASDGNQTKAAQFALCCASLREYELLTSEFSAPSGQSISRHQARFGLLRDHPANSIRAYETKPYDQSQLIDSGAISTSFATFHSADMHSVVADYLAFDLSPSLCSLEHRAQTSNLQLVSDRLIRSVIADVPRHSVDGHTRPLTDNQRVIICRDRISNYMSAGIAQIDIDRPRIVRAAALRLAFRLVHLARQGDRTFREDELISLARITFRGSSQSNSADSETDVDQFSFSAENLLTQFLEANGENCLTQLQLEFDAIQNDEPVAGQHRLTLWIEHHEQELSNSPLSAGAVRAKMESLAWKFLGSAAATGLCREVLLKRILSRFEFLGCDQTRQFLVHLKSEFQLLRDWCQSQYSEPAVTPLNLFEKWLNAQRKPQFPLDSRTVALQKTYVSACQSAFEWIRFRYRSEACRYVESLASEMMEFLSEVSSAGDLRELSRPDALLLRASSRLVKLGDLLSASFHQTRTRTDEFHNVMLMPDWGSGDYDMRLDKLLEKTGIFCDPKHQVVWSSVARAISEEILHQSPTPPPQYQRLWPKWLDEDRTPDVQIAIRMLTQACGRFLMTCDPYPEFDTGTLNQFLSEMPTAERMTLWRRFVIRSQPLIPFEKSVEASEIGKRLNFQSLEACHLDASLWQELITTFEEITGASAQQLKKLSGKRLCLVQHSGGFPLMSHAGISQFESSYDLMSIQRRRGLHLLTNANVDYLPLLPFRPEEITRIQRGWRAVEFGCVIGVIDYHDHAFWLSSLRTEGEAPHTAHVLNLGHHFQTMLENCCQNEHLTQGLERAWNNWVAHATTSHWAVLYSATMWNLSQLFEKSKDRLWYESTFPGMNRLRILLDEIREQLNEQGDEGRAWISLWESSRARHSNQNRIEDPSRRRVQNYFRNTCLIKINSEPSRWMIDEDRVFQISLQAARVAAKRTNMDDNSTFSSHG